MKDLKAMAMLYDFYGPMLTSRQQELMRAYYLEDLSLAEIAGEDGVSRQAVHDLIKRSEAALHEYEARLGFVQEHRERLERLDRLEDALQQGDLKQAREMVAQLRQL